MENYEDLLKDMRNRLSTYQKVPYGEAIGAPYPYNDKGDMVWNDPDPYFIERSISAITDLLARAEKAERERDAAMVDLRISANCETCARECKRDDWQNCSCCDVNGCKCRGCLAGDNWEWRGMQEV